MNTREYIMRGLSMNIDCNVLNNTQWETPENKSHLNIAMLIVGTRGDVQPFVAIGKRLKASVDSQ